MPALRHARHAGELAAWGLDTGRPQWHDAAACADTPELHLADIPTKWARMPYCAPLQAAHICVAHCPVVADCTKDTQARTPTGVVQAGRVWTTLKGSWAPDIGCGVWCEHLRGGDG